MAATGRSAGASMVDDAPATGDRATGASATRVDGLAIRWRFVSFPIALTLFGCTLVLVRLGHHPGFAYNWETYTAWRFFPFWENPSAAIFDLTDGLMTDSGFSPLVALPAWVGFTLGGVGLTSLRVPIALLAALAVPLMWLVGTRLANSGPPAIESGRTSPKLGTRSAPTRVLAIVGSVPVVAAVLLAVSPAYLIYARTATIVGISLTPALLATYAMVRVLQNPQGWRWLAALQLLLVLNSYGYAVIRFLWPIALLLLMGELLWRRGERRWFLVALGITAATLPAALVFIDQQPGYEPRAAIERYYNGRGEQVLALRDDPAGYNYYLEPTEEEQAAGGVQGSSTELALRLVGRNARDFGKLLLDRGTGPALTDFWNPHGRLLPWLLVPFFALGAAASLWRMRYRVEDRALQALFWGFSLPLLLTSQVHIGRLILAIPFMCILIAGGIALASAWLAGVGQRASPRLDARLVQTGVVVAVVVAAAWAGWRDYRAMPGETHEARVVDRLAADAPTLRESGRDAVYVRGGDNQTEIEAITVAGYRLVLDGRYQFVDLSAGESPSPTDERPVLYTGGLLDRLQIANGIPAQCTAIYYIEPFALDRFRAIAGTALPGCTTALAVVPLGE